METINVNNIEITFQVFGKVPNTGKSLLYFHGGFDSKLVDDSTILQYVKAGATVYAMNYADPMSLDNDLLMAKGLIEHVHSKAGKVFVLGISRGGYVAALATEESPDLVKAAVFCVAPMDIRTMDVQRFGTNVPVEYFSKSPIDYVSSLKNVPIGLAYGRQDDIVPASQGQELHDALVKVEGKCLFGAYKGGHSLITSNPVVNRDIINFFIYNI